MPVKDASLEHALSEVWQWLFKTISGCYCIFALTVCEHHLRSRQDETVTWWKGYWQRQTYLMHCFKDKPEKSSTIIIHTHAKTSSVISSELSFSNETHTACWEMKLAWWLINKVIKTLGTLVHIIGILNLI